MDRPCTTRITQHVCQPVSNLFVSSATLSIHRFVFQTNASIPTLPSIYPVTRSNWRPVSVENSLKEKPPWEEKLKAYYVTPWTPQGSNASGVQENRPASVNHMTTGRPDGQLAFSSTVWCLQRLPKFNSYFYYLISQRAWLDVCHAGWWNSQTSQL